MPDIRQIVLTVLAGSLFLSAGIASAHDASEHKVPATTASLPVALPASAGKTLPFDNIGGSFTLTDHFGKQRTDADFHGRFLLIFFGYANCESICPVGLQRMTAAFDELGAGNEKVQPVLITVDPENDTPAALAAQMPKVHPQLLGLTGTPEQIQAAMKADQIESTQVSQSADGDPVYAHGSFIYLMRPDGTFATLIPPVLGIDKMAGILRRFVN